jgi:hypothetical protein
MPRKKKTDKTMGLETAIDIVRGNATSITLINRLSQGEKPPGTIFQDIPLLNGYASGESSTFDLPDGYWSGKNMVPYEFGKFRAVHKPTTAGATFTGTLHTVFIDESGMICSL